MSSTIVDRGRNAKPGHEQQLLRETLPSLEHVQTAVTKTYRRRFPDLQDSEAGARNISRVEARVHKGLEYLIPLVEFAKLQGIYLDLVKKRSAGSAAGSSLIWVRRSCYGHGICNC